MSIENAFVTMVLSESYVRAGLVLGSSLRRHNPSNDYRTICIIPTNSDLTDASKHRLSHFWNELHLVDLIESHDEEKLKLLGRPELGPTMTKLHVWNLESIGVKKAVFLDADMLCLAKITDLFESDAEFAACPDAGWPDCFNSGLFLFKPSECTFKALMDHVIVYGSFDGI